MTATSPSREHVLAVLVETAARLHFGLVRVRQGAKNRFGGLGGMVAKPGAIVSISPDTQWRFLGKHAARAEEVVASLRAGDFLAPNICAKVDTGGADHHVGLGLGTQLALAIAVGLQASQQKQPIDICALAQATGRGKRSGIGLRGFIDGGLIADPGVSSNQTTRPVGERIAWPEAWRFLLLRPKELLGANGAMEAAAFDRLNVDDDRHAETLERLLAEELLPSAKRADFAPFSAALFEYGRLAGETFAPFQSGGCYATAELASAVRRLREMEIAGVGQSSWGPTLFALFENELAARDVVHAIQTDRWWSAWHIELTHGANEGAKLTLADAKLAVSAHFAAHVSRETFSARDHVFASAATNERNSPEGAP